MNLVDAVVLGLVQGLTEFLPVSSSGHLVLTQELLDVSTPGAALEVAVHIGTLVAVLIYYRKDILQIVRDVFSNGPLARLGWMVVVGTIPAVLVGLFLKDQIEAALDSPRIAAYGLLGTGVFLLVTRLAKRRPGEPTFGYAFIVGCAQALAILPGVSRSGSTIGTGMLLGDEPVNAARFSFLLSIPAILGGAVLTAAGGRFGDDASVIPLTVATVVAGVSGYASIVFLVKLLGKGRLWPFGPYCLVAGGLALWLLRNSG